MIAVDFLQRDDLCRPSWEWQWDERWIKNRNEAFCLMQQNKSGLAVLWENGKLMKWDSSNPEGLKILILPKRIDIQELWPCRPQLREWRMMGDESIFLLGGLLPPWAWCDRHDIGDLCLHGSRDPSDLNELWDPSDPNELRLIIEGLHWTRGFLIQRTKLRLHLIRMMIMLWPSKNLNAGLE